MAEDDKKKQRDSKSAGQEKAKGNSQKEETASPSEAAAPSPSSIQEGMLNEEILQRLETLSEAALSRMVVDYSNLNKFLKSTKRLLLTNFLMGLARGVGGLLGATLVGGMIVWGVAVAFDRTMAAFKQDINVDSIVREVAEFRTKLMDAFEEEDTPEAPAKGGTPTSAAVDPTRAPTPEAVP